MFVSGQGNMTDDERADLTYWYKYVEDGKYLPRNLLGIFLPNADIMKMDNIDNTNVRCISIGFNHYQSPCCKISNLNTKDKE